VIPLSGPGIKKGETEEEQDITLEQGNQKVFESFMSPGRTEILYFLSFLRRKNKVERGVCGNGNRKY